MFHWQAYYLSFPDPTRAWYCVSCACKGVATTPVPMAQTGSLGFCRWLLKSNQKERNRTSWWFSHPFEHYYILRKIIFPTTFKRYMLTSLEGTQIGSSPQVGELVQPPPREWTQLGLHLVKQDLQNEKTSGKMTSCRSFVPIFQHVCWIPALFFNDVRFQAKRNQLTGGNFRQKLHAKSVALGRKDHEHMNKCEPHNQGKSLTPVGSQNQHSQHSQHPEHDVISRLVWFWNLNTHTHTQKKQTGNHLHVDCHPTIQLRQEVYYVNEQKKDSSNINFTPSRNKKSELITHQYRICQANDLGFIKPDEDFLRTVKPLRVNHTLHSCVEWKSHLFGNHGNGITYLLPIHEFVDILAMVNW